MYKYAKGMYVKIDDDSRKMPVWGFVKQFKMRKLDICNCIYKKLPKFTVADDKMRIGVFTCAKP